LCWKCVWAPAGVDRGRYLPHRIVVQCFYALAVTEKKLSRRNIYALFSQPVVGFWGLPRSPPGLHPGTPLGDFRPRPIICPPVEKILRATMVVRLQSEVFYLTGIFLLREIFAFSKRELSRIPGCPGHYQKQHR